MTEAMIRKKPGMASVKDMPLLQDGPPPGGFAPVRYARRISNTGPSAMAIFLTVSGAFAWGMYQVGQGNKIRRALKEEKYAARRTILPILQAEEDERFVSEWKKYLDYEADVMKDVPGWKVGENVYNSGRWMPPATGELRPDVCRCRLCDTYYIDHVKDACAFLGDGMSRIESLEPLVHGRGRKADSLEDTYFGVHQEQLYARKLKHVEGAQWTGIVTTIASEMLKSNMIEAVVCVQTNSVS